MNIAISINNQTLSAQVEEPLVAASVGVDTFTVELDPSWEGFVTTIIFQRENLSREVLWTGRQTTVPWEVLAEPGPLYISALGVREGMRRPTAVMEKPLTLRKSGRLLGGEPRAYTAALWGQTLEEVQRLKELLGSAEGLPGIPGPQGPQGEPGVSPQISLQRFSSGGKSGVHITVYTESNGVGQSKTVSVYDGQTTAAQAYVLPVAAPETLGGVKPAAKTEAMTQAVGVDADGRLWATPSAGEALTDAEGVGF